MWQHRIIVATALFILSGIMSARAEDRRERGDRVLEGVIGGLLGPPPEAAYTAQERDRLTAMLHSGESATSRAGDRAGGPTLSVGWRGSVGARWRAGEPVDPVIAPRPSLDSARDRLAAGGMVVPSLWVDGMLTRGPRAPRPDSAAGRGELPALYQYGTGPVGLRTVVYGIPLTHISHVYSATPVRPSRTSSSS